VAQEHAFGFVYVLVETGDSPYYKIGMTVGHPDDRYRNLQTGNPRELKEWAVFPFPKAEVKRVEDMMHKRFSEYRVNGEWFEMGDKQRTDMLNTIFDELQAVWKDYARNGTSLLPAKPEPPKRNYTADLPDPAWLRTAR
jgi:hypothetical protein